MEFERIIKILISIAIVIVVAGGILYMLRLYGVL